MTGRSGYLRKIEDEALLALECISRKIIALESAGASVPQPLREERARLSALVSGHNRN